MVRAASQSDASAKPRYRMKARLQVLQGRVVEVPGWPCRAAAHDSLPSSAAPRLPSRPCVRFATSAARSAELPAPHLLAVAAWQALANGLVPRQRRVSNATACRPSQLSHTTSPFESRVQQAALVPQHQAPAEVLTPSPGSAEPPELPPSGPPSPGGSDGAGSGDLLLMLLCSPSQAALLPLHQLKCRFCVIVISC